MKKIYIKPSITFEKLSMSTELYANCAMNVTFVEWECPIPVPEWNNQTVFQDHNCDWSNDNGMVCYHVPTASMNVFGS